ncbi:blastula protease 10-like [Glandiceps talaboti]
MKLIGFVAVAILGTHLLTVTALPYWKRNDILTRNLNGVFGKEGFDATAAETAYTSGAIEGDMVMTTDQQQEYEESNISDVTKRKAVNQESSFKVWPDAIIPYEFTTLDDSMKSYAEAAMLEWEDKTCLRFVQYPAPGVTHQGKLTFLEGSGCSAAVGFKDATRKITLNKNDCKSIGVVLHELGHSLGLWHEHTRPDRDGFVVVNDENIMPGEENNFNIKDWSDIDTHDVPYDVSSIMHYGTKAFSANGQTTIDAEDDTVQSSVGKQVGLTHLDHKIVNIMYKCNEHCDNGLQCSNGGYVGLDCTCVCPRGLGGITCDDVDTETGTLSTPDYPAAYGNNRYCHWLLKAPEGFRIAIAFNNFNVEGGGATCPFDRVEIRHKQPYFDGYPPRYCSTTLNGDMLESVDNTILIGLYSDDSLSFEGFTASYLLI